MNKRQRERRHPIYRDVFQRLSSAKQFDDGTYESAIQESKHRVVELMMLNPSMIDVMRETDNKSKSRRNRWDFNQSNSGTEDQITKNSDM